LRNAAIPAEQFPPLIEMLPPLHGCDPAAEFDRGLDLLLTGLRAPPRPLREPSTSLARRSRGRESQMVSMLRLGPRVGIGLALAILVGCAGPSGPEAGTPSPPPDTRSPVPSPSPEPPPTVQPTPPSTEETHPPEDIDPPSGGTAATQLRVTAACEQGDPGRSVVTFRWRPAPRRGDVQRLDVTAFLDGFETGRFMSSERLPPGASIYRWEGLEPFGYRWRVLTRHGDAWTTSRQATFSGPVCVSDVIDG